MRTFVYTAVFAALLLVVPAVATGYGSDQWIPSRDDEVTIDTDVGGAMTTGTSSPGTFVDSAISSGDQGKELSIAKVTVKDFLEHTRGGIPVDFNSTPHLAGENSLSPEAINTHASKVELLTKRLMEIRGVAAEHSDEKDPSHRAVIESLQREVQQIHAELAAIDQYLGGGGHVSVPRGEDGLIQIERGLAQGNVFLLQLSAKWGWLSRTWEAVSDTASSVAGKVYDYVEKKVVAVTEAVKSGIEWLGAQVSALWRAAIDAVIAASDFGRGFVEGLVAGGVEFVREFVGMLKGLMSFIWKLATDTTNTVRNLGNTISQVYDAVKEDPVTILKGMFPDEYVLFTEWSSLSDEKRGFYIGKIISKHGLEYFTGRAIFSAVARLKRVKRAAGSADEIADAGRTAKRLDCPISTMLIQSASGSYAKHRSMTGGELLIALQGCGPRQGVNPLGKVDLNVLKKFGFEPPKNARNLQSRVHDLLNGRSARGFLDKKGNVWSKDKLHKNHFDVQLKNPISGHDYLNIAESGKILTKGFEGKFWPL